MCRRLLQRCLLTLAAQRAMRPPWRRRRPARPKLTAPLQAGDMGPCMPAQAPAAAPPASSGGAAGDAAAVATPAGGAP